MISIYVQYHTHVMQNVNMDTPQCLQILSANAVAPAGKGPPGLGQLRGMDGGQVKKLTNCILMLIKPGNLFVGPKQLSQRIQSHWWIGTIPFQTSNIRTRHPARIATDGRFHFTTVSRLLAVRSITDLRRPVDSTPFWLQLYFSFSYSSFHC